MTTHGIFTTFSFQLTEMLPEDPLIVLFWKSAAEFQERRGRACTKPSTSSCNTLVPWAIKLEVYRDFEGTNKCHCPLWRWHLPACLDISQPAWLSWRTLLVCRANMDLYFWASGGWDLPVSCSCSLFHRVVASCRDTSSFFFHTHFSHDAFSEQELWRNISTDAFLRVAGLHFEAVQARC